MAYTGVMTTEAEIDAKSGAGVSASVTDVMKTAWTLDAEALVNCAMRYDASTYWASITATAKPILSGIVSSLVAIECIMYDTDGYTKLREAESKVNILRDSAMRGLSLIKDTPRKDFIKG